MDMLLVLAILAGAVWLFASEKFSVDFVAVLVLGAVLEDKTVARRMTERNHELGRQFFSYSVLRTKLRALLAEFAGVT